jgi:hypothetical protein
VLSNASIRLAAVLRRSPPGTGYRLAATIAGEQSGHTTQFQKSVGAPPPQSGGEVVVTRIAIATTSVQHASAPHP